MKRHLFSLLTIALAASAFTPAAAQQRGATGSLIERTTSPQPATAETIGYTPDGWQRMTVAVNVGGRGPYRFIVDTGAERTVISSELARQLGLVSGGDVTLASVSTVSRVPSVMIDNLVVGRRTLSGIQAPALLERHIGAQGMLGVDSLRSQRVIFDFANRELTLTASHIEDDRRNPDEIVVRGRTRLGRLVITNASVDGQRITVIVDTGSQVTVGNDALRRQLARRGRLGETRILALTGVTGDLVNADYTVANRVRIGGLHVNDMPIAFSDVALFHLLGLRDRPAILLGMDMMRLFDRVSIDFANSRVRLLPPHSARESGTRLAALATPRGR